MTIELSRVRSMLSQVPGLLRQRNILSAVKNLHDGLTAFCSQTKLLRSEKGEFAELVERASFMLSINQELRRIYPLAIAYAPGKERELLGNLRALLIMLTEESAARARELAAEIERRKVAALERAKELLIRGETEKSRKAFAKIIAENPTDPTLRATIADIFIKAEHYTEALEHLSPALEGNPQASKYYNRYAMMLRKLQDFEAAEQYLLRALEHADGDEVLFFNLGRVYMDWRRWEKAQEMAQKALDLKPDFPEARKLLDYVAQKVW